MMKKMKKGAASFYVVIFTALMMSVVVLSFVRLMLSEQTQTSGDDLSTSAYDAALAGVEDAKALLKYCAQNPGASKCQGIYSTENCGDLINVMNRGGWVDESGDQEYTCVKMANVTEDYRVTISGEGQRVAMVPLKAENGQTFDQIKIEWSSASSSNIDSVAETPLLPKKSEKPTPAMVTAQLIDGQNPQAQWNDGKVRSSLSVLYPFAVLGNGATSVSSGEINNAAELEEVNTPKRVNCEVTAAKTTCRAILQVSSTAYNGGDISDYLLLGTPYGDTDTDFVVTLLSGNNVVNFEDAQVLVDSTGRTNDRYRRVEARVSLTDTSLYPEFTLQLSGDGDSGKLSKAFYVTKNCWRASNGKVESCDNSGDI